MLWNIPLGLKYKESFSTLSQFHCIIHFLFIDTEFNLQSIRIEREHVPSFQTEVRVRISRIVHGMENMLNLHFLVR